MGHKIQIGTGPQGGEIDLEELLKSRLLIQANSGGGKSWALRRISEQLFGHVPITIIDPEGEFATLREKFDFILVGKGGETPAFPPSAAHVAEKLLELRASAVCDIYELKPHERHRWVRLFLEAVIDAPKNLWHPRIIIVDESHLFCMDTKTEILTDEGWKNWKEVKAGDISISFDPETSEYKKEEIKRVIYKNYEGEMVSLKSDGIDCLVTPDHRVVYTAVQRAKGRYGKMYGPYVRPASEIPTNIFIPKGGAPEGKGIKGLSVDECYAIGWVSTDGHFSGVGKDGKYKKYISIEQSISTVKDGLQMTEELGKLSKKLGATAVYSRAARSHRMCGKYEVNSSETKTYYFGKEVSERILRWTGDEIHRIPRQIIKGGSKKQLEAILLGMLHGDGTCGKPHWGYKGWGHFYPGHDEGLADDFQEICTRLGVSTSKVKVPQNGQWTVLLSRRRHHSIRKSKKVMFSGIVWDITVPSGAFVARRNGKVFVTGNCPEKGQGESEAFGSMVDLATRGRKRGLSAVFATQRLSKLAKNATAELLNRLVGPTFEDLDLDRAADILSVVRGGRELFNREMKTLPPGNFYGLGRAISKEMIKIQIGPVITTHPEMGTYTMEPPPTPEKIRSLLPMLADLPKMAEEKIRTEAELRSEIRALKVQLTDRPEVLPQKTEVLEIPIIKDDELKKIEELTSLVDKKIVEFADVGKLLSAAAASLHGMMSQAIGPQGVKDLVLKAALLRGNLRPPAPSPAVSRAPDLFLNPPSVAVPVAAPLPAAAAVVVPVDTTTEAALVSEPVAADPLGEPAPEGTEAVVDAAVPAAPGSGDVPVPTGELSRPQKAILRALAEFLVIEVNKPSRHQVAGWLGIKVSGSFLNNLGALRARGLVTYDGIKLIITNEGLKEAPPIEVKPTSEDIFTHLLEAVSAPQQAMLKLLRENGGWMSRDDLARSLGVQVTGSFMNNLATLHTAELLDYGEGDMKKFVKIADWTMLSGTPAA